MSFLGKDVTLRIASPTIGRPIISPQTATVSGSAVEFSNTSRFDITDPDDGFAVVNADIDIKERAIVYTIDDRGGSFSQSEGFNGFIISDADRSIAPITGVAIASRGNDLGISQDKITVTEDAILVDVEGLRYRDGDRIVLFVTFAPIGPNAIAGTAADDDLAGTAGRDKIDGFGGSDILAGGGGKDSLFGGRHSDVLIGGLGRDLLNGGADADRFDYDSLAHSQGRSRDVIVDFERGIDKIDLRTIDADTGTARNQAFTFIEEGPLERSAGDLSFRFLDRRGGERDRTLITGDVDGDGDADLSITLVGLIALASDDFIL